jgi:hypothetical protein
MMMMMRRMMMILIQLNHQALHHQMNQEEQETKANLPVEPPEGHLLVARVMLKVNGLSIP